MSVLPNDTIKIIAESAGISNLPDEIAQQLASDVEYRIREIAQEAIKFMKHSKRDHLSTDDINNALGLRNIEQLYGYSCSANDHSLLKFQKTTTTTQAIYFLNDKEMTFQEIASQPLPKVPRDPSLSAHWLALEGVQPLIPQNPSPYEIEEHHKNLHKKFKSEKALQLEQQAQALLTQQNKGNEKSGDNNNNNNNNGNNNNGNMIYGMAQLNGINTVLGGNNLQKQDPSIPGIHTLPSNTSTIVKPTVKHVLSKEIQMFYEKITNSVKSDNQKLFDAALHSLKSDSSLHQLLPYFINFISVQVTQNLTNLELLNRLMKMAQAILESKHLKPELYLHQLMPSILTCLVGKKLCNSPSENHWELRDFAARLVSFVCRKFGDVYSSLQGRITKTLVQTLHDTTKPLTTHYGAIVGLSGLGRNVIQFLLLPYVPKYYKLLEPELNNNLSNPIKSMEANRVLNSIIDATGKFLIWVSEGENILSVLDLKDDTTSKKQPISLPIITEFSRENILKTLKIQYQSLFDLFGEKLLAYIKPDNDSESMILIP
ncbi:TATA-binding protein-associated-factor [Dictyostelium discoideum AX4]|uniref:TATA-binding protein-associated-factor n=1 Tax=Dictyostelium discoideum TaxID=44689 RepID=Q54IW7_DICDI|nr:TATA-binding protein-associated-factor [Dictyostelium discoideum AX4]EAL63207.1 TATA-binding protein-associated-factor [Dictyostelium discoideum AX4]|eukprot:XP_636709.1 TATA-binding protein-associated-factor [Dictyostelium discoideum AX4]